MALWLLLGGALILFGLVSDSSSLGLIGCFIVGVYFLSKKFIGGAGKELGAGEYGAIRAEIKRAVLARQRGRCNHYSCAINKYLEFHHILPRHLRGDNRVSNIRALCPNHHASAHDARGNGKASYGAVPRYLRRMS